MRLAIITATTTDPAPFFWCTVAAGAVIVLLSGASFLRRTRPKPQVADQPHEPFDPHLRVLERRVDQAQAAFDRSAVTHRGRGAARAALLKAKHDLKTYSDANPS